MPMPGMHVGPADAAEGNIDNALAGIGDGRLDLPDLAFLRAGIDKCLHFAVTPPSTIRHRPDTQATNPASKRRVAPGYITGAVSWPLRP